jgi:cytochrome c-type biogenesis protein CcmH
MRRVTFGLLLLALAGAAAAKEAAPLAEDPVVEARLKKISKELRCLVCQNETLADSQADLAKDLRREVRGKISQGLDDEQIKAYLTQRYGNFVLYRPPVNATTVLLWFGPFLLLLGAAYGVARFIKQRRRALEETPLTPEEAARIKSLLPEESNRA